MGWGSTDKEKEGWCMHKVSGVVRTRRLKMLPGWAKDPKGRPHWEDPRRSHPFIDNYPLRDPADSISSLDMRV